MKSVSRWLLLLLLFAWSVPFGTCVLLGGVSITVAWDPSPDSTVTSYNLYYGQVGGTSTNKLLAGSNLSASIPNLTLGQTYFVYVKAANSAGLESQPSNIINYTASSGPQFVAISDQTVVAGTQLSVTLAAVDTALISPVFTYALVSGPTGAAVNATSGVFTWTPTTSQAPGTYTVKVQVTDNATPPLSSTTSFNVNVTTAPVSSVNSAPVLVSVAGQNWTSATSDQLLANGSFESALTGWNASGNLTIKTAAPYQASAGSGLVVFNDGQATPNGTLSQTLSTTPGGNYTLSFDVGVISYNLNEQRLQVTVQGGSTLLSQVVILTGLGGGKTQWVPKTYNFVADGNSMTVTFKDVSTATIDLDLVLDNVRLTQLITSVPVLPATAGNSISASLSARDSDTPAQALTYSLVNGPSGAAVNPSTGLFTWSPPNNQNTGPVDVTVKVCDNGSPSLSASGKFQLNVVAPVQVNTAPIITSVSGQGWTSGQGSDVISNGSFESGYANWTATGNQYAQDSTAYPQPWYKASNGKMLVAFNDGQRVPNATLSQTFSTVPGQTYTLSFDYGTFSANTTEQRIAVTVMGQSQLLGKTLSAFGAGGGVTKWLSQSDKIVADSTTTTLMFQDVSAATLDNDLILDNVRCIPDIQSVPVLSVPAGGTVSAQLSATDAELLSQLLTFSLVSGPSGATVTPSGVFTWTPTTPGSFPIQVSVSDNGSPALSDSKSFTVNVTAPNNTPPTLSQPPNLTVSANSSLTWQLTASDKESAASSLTYSLVSGPAGASVTPDGVFSWSPGSSFAGTANTITVKVTDNGLLPMSDSKSFTVAVSAPNTAPTLGSVPNQTVAVGSLLSVALLGGDADTPAQTLTYSITAGPTGASINPTTGLFTWKPTDAQAPSTNLVTVKVTDSGSPALSATRSFTVTVYIPNRPPVWNAMADQKVSPGQILMLSLSASDPDPGQTLTYSLVSGPSGVKVDPTTGVLSWRLSKSAAASTNKVTVMVADSGSPQLSANMSFLVIVLAKNSGQSSRLANLKTLSWTAQLEAGREVRFNYPLEAVKQSGTWLHYLEASEDLVHWSTVGVVSDRGELSDGTTMNSSHRFYRIRSHDLDVTEPSEPASQVPLR